MEAELESLKGEADILNRALDNVYREKDRVLDQLDQLANPQSGAEEGGERLVSLQTEGAESPSGEGTPSQISASQRVYKVLRGDTLSQIAKKHNTTTDALLRLNPYLRDRSDYMVWENDLLTIPVRSGGNRAAAPEPASLSD
ncbi:MAG: LysM peptidoglycan-binding domain-containing protein [Deltaproteobacteria bacterium]|nr:LysM peptidoglycan-binding domain-containing protein [Deltaproteobacteria bacterium]